MASRLRRATLVLNPAKPAPVAPVGEVEAIPVLGANLLARSASERTNDAIEASTDILYRKGAATTSRWRSYDHKEAFEPAQAATAPPSDADAMGSWLKYDGSVPVTTPLDQAVRDEELPTSWTKYEEKPPLASLLESREKRSKAPIYLATAAPPAPEQRAQPEVPAAPNPIDRAEPQPAPQPAEPAAVAQAPPVPAEPPKSETVRALNPEPETEAEIPEAPIAESIAEAAEPALNAAASAPETPAAPAPQPPETAESVSLSTDSGTATQEPEPSDGLPIEAAPTSEPEAAAAPIAFVEDPPVLATPLEPMAAEPLEEPLRSEAPIEPAPAELLSPEFVGASNFEPKFTAAPIPRATAEALPSEPELPSPAPASAAELPDEPEASAELPALAEEPEAPAAGIGDAWDQPRPIDVSEEREPSVDVPLEPAPAPMAPAEAAPAVAPEEPQVLAAAAEPMATSLPVAEPPRSEASTEPELLASAVTAHEPEQPGFDSDVETRAAASVPETAAEATPSGAAPTGQHELLQMAVSAIKKPGSAKKAMLTRLAEMLELALSAKRSARNTGNPPVASEPEASALSTGSAEPSPDAVQPEAFLPPEPASSLPEIETPAEAIEPAAPEIVADAVVSVEAPIAPVLLATTGDAGAVQSEAFAPPETVSTVTSAAPLADTPPEITETPGLQSSMEADEPRSVAPEAEPMAELAAPAVMPPVEAEAEASLPGEHDAAPEDTAPLPPPEDGPPAETAFVEALPAVASADASPQEPAREPTPEAASPVAAEPLESSISREEMPEAPSAEDDIPLAADAAPQPAEQPIDPEPEAAAPIEAAPVTEAVAVEAAAAPVPLAPVTPIDEEQAAREALASDLADMIHNVLSTKQFATRATKADRYFSASPVQATEEPDDFGEGEIAADAIPHPVAIKARLGRMERVLALLSLGMMILVGYFAISLWRDDGMVAAQAPAIAPAASSSSDRARNATRGLGATAIDTSKTAVSPALGGPRPVDRR